MVIKCANNDSTVRDIEDSVGARATINTIRKDDKDLLDNNTISLDKTKSQIISLAGATEVVYWVLSVKTKLPSVVGIAWVKGEKKIFYGVVLPP